MITIMGRMATNFSRNNLSWDKFNYKGIPPGGTGKSEKKSFAWGSLFSDTCKNIETGVKSAKDSLVGAAEDVQNRAVAAGKVNTIVSTENPNDNEGFRNRVYASQPPGSEHFHNIF